MKTLNEAEAAALDVYNTWGKATGFSMVELLILTLDAAHDSARRTEPARLASRMAVEG